MPVYRVYVGSRAIGGEFARMQDAINTAENIPGAVVVDDGADQRRIVWKNKSKMEGDNHGQNGAI